MCLKHNTDKTLGISKSSINAFFSLTHSPLLRLSLLSLIILAFIALLNLSPIKQSHAALPACNVAAQDLVTRDGGILYRCDNNTWISIDEESGPNSTPEWRERTILRPDDLADGDEFGYSIDIGYGRLVVGAPSHGTSGAVYVYKKTQSRWLLEQKIIAGNAGDKFGFSVALHKDKIAVGAPLNDDSVNNGGAAYIYGYDGSTWVQEYKAEPSVPEIAAQFGEHLDLHDGVMIASAPFYDDGGNTDSGAAFVYRYTNSGWAQDQILRAADSAVDRHFGRWHINIDDNYTAVGQYNIGAFEYKTYLFRNISNTYTQIDKLDGRFNSINGDILVTGRDDINRVHKINGNTVTLQTTLSPADLTVGDYFGAGFAIFGDVLFSTSALDDDSTVNSSSAYIFKQRDDGSAWDQVKKFIPSNTHAEYRLAFLSQGDVSMHQNYAAASATNANNPATGNPAGAVHIFSYAGQSLWEEATANKIYPTKGSSGPLVGIGTDQPTANLDVSGALNVNSSLNAETIISGISGARIAPLPDSACTGAPDEGTLRFNADLKRVEVCNGTEWVLAVGDVDAPELVSTTPANFGSDVYRNTTLSMTFSEPVNKGTGNIIVRRLSDNSIFETIGVGDAAVTGDGTDTITITLLSELDANTSYYIVMSDTVFADDAENDFEGLYTKSGFTFTTEDKSPWEGETPIEVTKLFSGTDQESLGFGYSFDMSDEWIAVSANFEDSSEVQDGALYIYRNESEWKYHSKISNPAPSGNAQFGRSVSLSNDTIAIGAFGADNGVNNSGLVYVYVFDGANWNLQQTLSQSDIDDSDRFGVSVSLENDLLLVGADENTMNNGSAYIFERSGSAWTQIQKLTASDGLLNDRFGSTVSMHGNYIAINAYREDSLVTDSGAVYVFENVNGTWMEIQKLKDSTPATFDNFGIALDINEDFIIIGQPGHDNGASENAGLVSIYENINGTWALSDEILPSNTASFDAFGSDVNLENRTLFIGAANNDINGPNFGMTYIYTYKNGAWVEDQFFQSSDADADDDFGRRIIAKDRTAIISGLLEDPRGITDQGSIYIVTAGDVSPPRLTASTPIADQNGFDGASNIYLGFDENVYVDAGSILIRKYVDDSIVENISISSDRVTGSGTDTLSINPEVTLDGATSYYIQIASTAIRDDKDNYYGGISDTTTLAFTTNSVSPWQGATIQDVQTILPPEETTHTGGAAGNFYLGLGGAIYDANSGLMVTSSPVADFDGDDSGRAYIYNYNDETNLFDYIDYIAPADLDADDQFGQRIAIDKSNQDILITSHQDDDGGADCGAIYVFETTPIITQKQKIVPSDCSLTTILGRQNLKISGDFLFAPAVDYNSSEGAVYIFKKDPAGVWNQHQILQHANVVAGNLFGQIGLDVLGSTLVVGETANDASDANAGAAFVFIHNQQTDMWEETQTITGSDIATEDRFGHAISINDNYVFVSASPSGPSDPVRTGAVYVFQKQGNEYVEVQKLVGSDSLAGDSFGQGRLFGATNNTVIIGARYHDGYANSAGAIYIYTLQNGVWVQDQKHISAGLNASDQYGYTIFLDNEKAFVGAINDNQLNRPVNHGSIHYITAGDISSPRLVGSSPWDGHDEFVPTDHVRLYFNENVIVGTGTITIYRTDNDEVAAQIDITDGGITGSGTDIIVADMAVDLSDNTNYYIQISDTAFKDSSDNYFVGINDNTTLTFTTDRVSPFEGAAVIQQQYIPAPDQPNNLVFGEITKRYGDELFINDYAFDRNGDASALGAVYYYKQNPVTKQWEYQQTITGSLTSGAQIYGHALDYDGTHLIVGESSAERVYIYTKSGNDFIESTVLSASDNTLGDIFGGYVSLSGNNLFIGARGKNSSQGSVYHFTYDGTWNETQIIDSTKAESFGHQIAYTPASETLIISATTNDDATSNSGAVYIYKKDLSGQWTEEQALYPSDPETDSQFGGNISAHNNQLIIAAPSKDDSGADSGALYVFTQQGDMWTQTQKLSFSDIGAGDSIGSRHPSINNNTMIVGSRSDDESANNAGAAYIFTLENGVWTEQQKLLDPSGLTSRSFGFASQIDGNELIVTHPLGNGGGTYYFTADDSNAPFLTSTSPSDGFNFVKNDAPIVLTFNENVTAQSGGFITIYKDDGNVFETIASTSALVNGTSTNIITISPSQNMVHDQEYYVHITAGAFKDAENNNFVGINDNTTLNFMVESAPSPWTDSTTAYMKQKILPVNPETNASFGDEKLIVNGDFSFIGSWSKTQSGFTDSGIVEVYKLENDVWSHFQTLSPSIGPQTNLYFGKDIASSGNTLAIAAERSNLTESLAGAVVVYIFNGTNWVEQQVIQRDTPGASERFGSSIALHEDILFTASQWGPHPAGGNSGQVYVFERTGTVWTQTDVLLSDDAYGGERLGESMAYDPTTKTLVVSAHYNSEMSVAHGAIHVFIKNNGSWEFQQKIIPPDLNTNDIIGVHSVAIDKHTLSFGSWRHNTEGASWVYTRNNGIWSLEQKITASDAAGNAIFFGEVSSIKGNTLLISGTRFIPSGHPSNATSGKIYAYTRESGVWSEEFSYNPTTDSTTAYNNNIFGNGLFIIDENSFIAGSPGDDEVLNGSGAAFIITRTDEKAPQITSATPSNGFNFVKNDATISITFDEPVFADVGNMHFRNTYTDTVFKTFAADSSFVSGLGTNTINISIDQDFDYDTAYRLEFAANILKDADDNHVTDLNILDFTIEPAPSNWAGSTTAYVKQKILPNNPQSGSQFGTHSIKFNDDWAIIPSNTHDEAPYTNSGKVDIYRFNNNQWSYFQEIQPSYTAEDNLLFGRQVALSNDTVAIGAHNTDIGGVSAGIVSVYKFNGTSWIEEQLIQSTDIAAGDLFGHSLALNQNTLIVGAPREDDGAAGAGAIYIFERVGATWSQTEKLLSDEPTASEYMGERISYDPTTETIVAAAPNNNELNTDSGAIHIFSKASGAWAFEQKIIPADIAIGDFLGRGTIAINGNTLAVGSELHGTPGAIWIYTRNNNSWSLEQKIVASDAAGNAINFGQSLALKGNTLIAGAATINSNTGQIYAFTRDSGTWSEDLRYVASALTGDLFGNSVALYNDDIITAAQSDDDTVSNGGAAYIITRTDQTPPALLSSTPADDTTDVAADTDIILTFDQNITQGDGKIIIRRASDDSVFLSEQISSASFTGFGTDTLTFALSTELEASTAYYVVLETDAIRDDSGNAFFGLYDKTALNFSTEEGPSPWAGSSIEFAQKILAPDANTNGYFGTNVVMFGDFLAVSATYYDNGIGVDAGSVYMYERNSETNIFEFKQALNGSATVAGSLFGFDIKFNGNKLYALSQNDGRIYIYSQSGSNWIESSIIAPNNTGPSVSISISADGQQVASSDYAYNSDAGRVIITEKNGVLWNEKQIIVASDTSSNSSFGDRVLFDKEHLFVAASKDDSVGTNAGSVYIYEKNSTTGLWEEQQKITSSLATSPARFGRSLFANDDTLIVGANNGGSTAISNAFVFKKIAGTWTETQILAPADLDDFDAFGSLRHGTMTGNTVFIGAIGDNVGGTDDGSIYLYTNVVGTWTEDQKITAPDTTKLLGGVTTFNNDTLVSGAHGDDNLVSGAGAVYIFTRGDITGPSLVRTYPEDDATNINANQSLEIEFSEIVEAGNGNIFIKQTSDDAVVQTIETGSNSVAGYGTNTLTIELTEGLNTLTDYYLEIELGAIVDDTGNPYGGISDKTAWNFVTSAAVSVDHKKVIDIGGAGNACRINSSSAVECFGSSAFGQLGNDTNDVSYILTNVAGGEAGGAILGGVQDISVNNQHACAIRVNGDVFCWGNQANGRLGNGSLSAQAVKVPTQVLAGDQGGSVISDINNIDTGISSTCAVTNGGDGYCWGSGNLGNNIFNDQTGTPKRVLGGESETTYLEDLSEISIGGDHSCAVRKTDGSVFCWGDNTNGELGNGNTTNSASPVRVVAGEAFGAYLTGIIDVTANRNATCALRNDGVVFCWGDDSLNALGQGSAADESSLTPVRVVGGQMGTPYLENIVKISGSKLQTSRTHTAALTSSGEIIRWGLWDINPEYIIAGETNIGNETSRLTGATSIQLDNYIFCFRHTDTNDYCFGGTSYGHGNGLIADSLFFPTQLKTNLDDSQYLNATTDLIGILEAGDLVNLDEFGFAISHYDDPDFGNRIAIGTRGQNSDAGAVYIFEDDNYDDNWNQLQKLTGSNTLAGDKFGRSVAVADGRYVVGAHLNDMNGSDSGAAYIFDETTETFLLQDTDNDADDRFGLAVDATEYRVMVSAPYEENGGTDRGKLYEFSLYNGVKIDEIGPSDPENDARFGYSLTYPDPTTLVVGAPFKDEGAPDAGAAYVFFKDFSGWDEQVKIVPDDLGASDNFGFSVDAYQNTLVIGAPGQDGEENQAGAAYVYERFDGEWFLKQKFTPPVATLNGNFGYDVAVHQNTLVIGERNAKVTNSGTNVGAVWVYTQNNDTWEAIPRVLDNNPNNYRNFGHAVHVLKDTIMVGAPNNDQNGTDRGRVFAFKPQTDSSGPVLIASTPPNDGIDIALDTLFNITFDEPVFRDNGEIRLKNYADDSVIYSLNASDFRISGGGTNILTIAFPITLKTKQQYYIEITDDALKDKAGNFYGGTTDKDTIDFFTPDGSVKLLASDAETSDILGKATSIYGNTAVVTAPGEDQAASGAGAAYVFVKSGASWIEQQKLISNDGTSNDGLGGAIDIYEDTIILGAEYDAPNGTRSGSAYVFTRSGSTWTQQAKLIPSDGDSNDYFGHSVAVYKDMAIIGAHRDEDAGSNGGSTYLFTRSGSTWTQQAKILPLDVSAGYYFGKAVAVYEDTMFISAERDSTASSLAGSVYVFSNIAGTWTQQTKLFASNASSIRLFGSSLSVDRDSLIVGKNDSLNGDSAYIFVGSGATWSEQAKIDGPVGSRFGRQVSISGDKAIIGDEWDNTNGSNAGAIYIYSRSGSTWTQDQKYVHSSVMSGDNFGISVDISGNYVLIGSITDDEADTDAGAAYIYDIGPDPDTTPNQFAFVDQTDVAVSTVIESDIQHIIGHRGSAVTISTDAGTNAEYQICSDDDCGTVTTAWTSASNTIQDGEYLQLRLTTSATNSQAHNVTINAGGTSDVWTLTTASPSADEIVYFSGNNCSGSTAVASTGSGYGCTGSGACTSNPVTNSGSVYNSTINIPLGSSRSPWGPCGGSTTFTIAATPLYFTNGNITASSFAYFTGADCTGTPVTFSSTSSSKAYTCTGAANCQTGVMGPSTTDIGSVSTVSRRRGSDGACLNLSSTIAPAYPLNDPNNVVGSTTRFSGANCTGTTYANSGPGSAVYTCTGSGSCKTSPAGAGTSAGPWKSNAFDYRSRRDTSGVCISDTNHLDTWYIAN